MNLVISLRSCQSNHELGNEVMNFTLNLENLRSSLPAKFTPFGVVGMSQNFLRHCQGATKVLSDSPGLVELLAGLAFSYHSLPDGQAPLVPLF